MTKRRLSHQLLPILILLLATGLRFYLLDNQSFWNDEGNTARLSERSIRLIIEGTASDIHPPLYYLILRGWRELVGQSEFALRAFSAFVGVLTVAITMIFGRRWDTPRTGLLAGLLTAVSPPLIYYSQEARMYSLLGLLGVLSTWLFYEWLLSNQQHSRRWAIAYVLCLVAGLYTHYFFPAIIVVHNLYLAGWLLYHAWRHKSWRSLFNSRQLYNWIVMMIVALLLYAPWLPIFLRSAGRGTLKQNPTASFLAEAFFWLLFGPVLHRALLAAVLAIALTTTLRRLTFRFPPHIPLFFLWLIVPPLFMILVGSTEGQHFKFLTAVVPALTLLLAIRITTLWEMRITRPVPSYLQYFGYILAISLSAAVLYSSNVALNELYYNPAYFRADYRTMATQIKQEAHPNAGIILNAPNQWEVFTYYYDGPAEVYPFPKVNSTAAEITPQLEEIAAAHDRLYAIFWGEQGFDPERQVERWLDGHAFKAQDEWRGDVRFVSYAVPTAAATEMSTAVNLPVGEAITLQGYTLNNDTFQAGDIVQLTFFWQTAQPLSQRYKVFLHLIAFDGSLVAQRDSEPVGNLRPTNTWEVDETIIDNHGLLLPLDLPAGAYALHIGLYDIANPHERLPILTDSVPVDSWRLATIAVR